MLEDDTVILNVERCCEDCLEVNIHVPGTQLRKLKVASGGSSPMPASSIVSCAAYPNPNPRPHRRRYRLQSYHSNGTNMADTGSKKIKVMKPKPNASAIAQGIKSNPPGLEFTAQRTKSSKSMLREEPTAFDSSLTESTFLNPKIMERKTAAASGKRSS